MYVNYGDIDFFEYGVLVDTEHKGNERDYDIEISGKIINI